MAKATIRTLKVIKALAGKSLTGMPLQDITKAVCGNTDDNNKINCLRSLQDLQAVGFVIQLDNKNYALSTAMLGIATAYQLEIGQAQDRLASISQRVNANAHQYL